MHKQIMILGLCSLVASQTYAAKNTLEAATAPAAQGQKSKQESWLHKTTQRVAPIALALTGPTALVVTYACIQQKRLPTREECGFLPLAALAGYGTYATHTQAIKALPQHLSEFGKNMMQRAQSAHNSIASYPKLIAGTACALTTPISAEFVYGKIYGGASAFQCKVYQKLGSRIPRLLMVAATIPGAYYLLKDSIKKEEIVPVKQASFKKK